mmetsp:Transcript_36373/g.113322  ORF Transcript_36373/g.113322 Transcript_36373/m.113322 type:complete len:258 (-) Transcript_36373:224-997(-)
MRRDRSTRVRSIARSLLRAHPRRTCGCSALDPCHRPRVHASTHAKPPASKKERKQAGTRMRARARARMRAHARTHARMYAHLAQIHVSVTTSATVCPSLRTRSMIVLTWPLTNQGRPLMSTSAMVTSKAPKGSGQAGVSTSNGGPIRLGMVQASPHTAQSAESVYDMPMMETSMVTFIWALSSSGSLTLMRIPLLLCVSPFLKMHSPEVAPLGLQPWSQNRPTSAPDSILEICQPTASSSLPKLGLPTAYAACWLPL